ncbi:MAG TPA: aldo/keto reductase [Verrucomicrobiae bacterium]|nr:aldo/keto reductase [Verrucomicrobiae bacterium]
MKYRRFGRTNLSMPVISCGGMRYQHSWKDEEAAGITTEGQANLEATIRRALELGINHIETARGYGTSELQLGRILPRLPREQMIVQTKVSPCTNPKEFLATFNMSMSNLRLDCVDLLGLHGINNEELLDFSLRPNGCLKVARQLQKDGRVRFIGFSTHAVPRVILQAIESDEFDYVNLHWYFVNPLNWPAVVAATKRDLGVFIISPNDKGGKLQGRPTKMAELCAPLSPMQFNDLYCLARPEVHTLSCGAAHPGDFDEHVAALKFYDRAAETIAPIERRLREEMARVLGADWCERWNEELPEYSETPYQVNVIEILRLWTYAKSLGLIEWGKMRYNLLGGNGGHWFPGEMASNIQDEKKLLEAVAKNPFASGLPQILREAHELLFDQPKKRLSQS